MKQWFQRSIVVSLVMVMVIGLGYALVKVYAADISIVDGHAC